MELGTRLERWCQAKSHYYKEPITVGLHHLRSTVQSQFALGKLENGAIELARRMIGKACALVDVLNSRQLSLSKPRGTFPRLAAKNPDLHHARRIVVATKMFGR